MAEDEQVDLSLADVLRALEAEIRRADDDGRWRGARVETATVDLDVAIEARGDGDVAFWVGKVQGSTKRARTTRLSVTLRASGTQADLEVAAARRADEQPQETSPAAVAGEVAPPEPRPLGLVDVLADALKTIAQSASTSGGGGQRPRPGWPEGVDSTRGGSD